MGKRKAAYNSAKYLASVDLTRVVSVRRYSECSANPDDVQPLSRPKYLILSQSLSQWIPDVSIYLEGNQSYCS